MDDQQIIDLYREHFIGCNQTDVELWLSRTDIDPKTHWAACSIQAGIRAQMKMLRSFVDAGLLQGE